jgi:heme/copper-type cytochrome/quinol oxidase subunit 2
MLLGSLAIFAFVMGLLLIAWRRAPPERGDEDQAMERVWVHRLGIGFPMVVLAALLTFGLVIGEALLPRAAPDTVTVRAEARQWAWTFGYEDLPGRSTHGVLHIPARRPVDVEITTVDVVHSFWVPRLGGKLDAIPGHVNRLRLQADAPGRYAGVSAEFSGVGYSTHSFYVVAHDPAGWNAFIERGGE